MAVCQSLLARPRKDKNYPSRIMSYLNTKNTGFLRAAYLALIDTNYVKDRPPEWNHLRRFRIKAQNISWCCLFSCLDCLGLLLLLILFPAGHHLVMVLFRISLAAPQMSFFGTKTSVKIAWNACTRYFKRAKYAWAAFARYLSW